MSAIAISMIVIGGLLLILFIAYFAMKRSEKREAQTRHNPEFSKKEEDFAIPDDRD